MTVDERYDHEGKVYVDVITYISKAGEFEPLEFIWEDGVKYEIDRVVEKRKAFSARAGGAGLRYTVLVKNRPVYMFLEEGRWFMERR